MFSLAIDPSVNNVGWSIFNSRARKKHRAWHWGTIYPEGNNLGAIILDALQQLEYILEEREVEISYLITEQPCFFSSEKGEIAAHMNYTIDLASMNWYLAGRWGMDHRTHFPVTPPQWKGNVDKKVTERAFVRAFPRVALSSITEHAIDSVMLHRWWIQQYATGLRRYVRHISPEDLLKLI